MKVTTGYKTMIDHHIGKVNKILVSGYLVNALDHNFIVFKEGSQWNMTELKSGLRVAYAPTRRQAIVKGLKACEECKTSLDTLIQRALEYQATFTN